MGLCKPHHSCRWLKAMRPWQIRHELRNTPERKNSLDSSVALGRKSREELFLWKQEFNPSGIMQARHVLIVYASLTMRLPGESPQQEQLIHYTQEQTLISPLLQSYHLPHAPHGTLLGRHMDVPVRHNSGTGSGMHTLGGHSTPSSKEVSPHFHPDTGLCLNKQVGQCSMSAILTYLIPQEFNIVRGGLY